MKKFILLLVSLLFVSCTRTVYVDKETNEIIETRKYSRTDFINLQRVDDGIGGNNCVYVDTYTDVLYMKGYNIMLAIMKADGTCLTYSEWKERNK